MVKLIGLVGTNSKKSTNRQLLQYISKHFSEQAEVELVEIKDIPMFNKPTPKVVPQEAKQLQRKSLQQMELSLVILQNMTTHAQLY